MVIICGLAPRKLALTLCIGIVFGIIPLVWGTSLICILMAHVFRLNYVALQSVNVMLYPVHLALLIPFYKLGAWLFPWGPAVPQHLFHLMFSNPCSFSLNLLFWVTTKSLAAWLVTVIPSALLIHSILRVTVLKNINSQDEPLNFFGQDI